MSEQRKISPQCNSANQSRGRQSRENTEKKVVAVVENEADSGKLKSDYEHRHLDFCHFCGYTPRLTVIRRKPKAAVINSVHQHVGEDRLNQKYRAQLNFCDRLAVAMMDKTRGAREDLQA